MDSARVPHPLFSNHRFHYPIIDVFELQTSQLTNSARDVPVVVVVCIECDTVIPNK